MYKYMTAFIVLAIFLQPQNTKDAVVEAAGPSIVQKIQRTFSVAFGKCDNNYVFIKIFVKYIYTIVHLLAHYWLIWLNVITAHTSKKIIYTVST